MWKIFTWELSDPKTHYETSIWSLYFLKLVSNVVETSSTSTWIKHTQSGTKRDETVLGLDHTRPEDLQSSNRWFHKYFVQLSIQDFILGMFRFSCVLTSIYIRCDDTSTLVYSGTSTCLHGRQRRPLGRYNILSLIMLRLNTTRLKSEKPLVSVYHCAMVTDKNGVMSSFLCGYRGFELRSSCLCSEHSDST